MKPIAANAELVEHLGELRARRPERVRTDEVASIVESLIATLSGDISLVDLKLYTELDALARFIQNAKAEIAAVRPEEISSHDIPLATDELDAVVGATEDATGKILDAAELLEALADQLEPAHAEQVRAAVTGIYEASNFQDITGQRITKVVKTLKHIESRVSAMLKAFGDELARIKQEPLPGDMNMGDTPLGSAARGDAMSATAAGNAAGQQQAAPPSAPAKDQDLLNGPQLPDDAKKQAEIDAILASLG